MDLIRSVEENGSWVDIGYISDYELDAAWGNEENDFELRIPLGSYLLETGEMIRIEEESDINGESVPLQIGGVVDSIEIDTESMYVIYAGRTWHGLLNSRIIPTVSKKDSYTLGSGNNTTDASVIINELIDVLSLGYYFTGTSITGIDAEPYECERFSSGYDILISFCEINGLKPMFRMINGKVQIEVVEAEGFSDVEMFDDEIKFTLKRNLNPVNHVVIGDKDNLDSPIMNLYTDENGNVYQYTKKSPAYKDAHYIKSLAEFPMGNETRSMFVHKEAEDTEKYEPLTSCPKDWAKGGRYYTIETDDETGEESYEIVDLIEEYKSVPNDDVTDAQFAKHYSNYFKRTKNSDGEYKYTQLKGTEEITSYSKLTKQPSSWKKNYKNYYVRRNDGVETTYSSAPGVTKNYYKPHSRRPSDWKTNYKAYYYISEQVYEKLETQPSDWDTNYQKYYIYTKKKYVHVPKTKKGKAPQFSGSRRYYKLVKRKTFKKIDSDKMPKWKSGKYYTQYTKTKAPKFELNKYYKGNKRIVAPARPTTLWQLVEYAPAFVKGKYYRQVIDHYESLVNAGLDALKEEWESDQATININDAGLEFDVLDRLSLSDQNTGIDCNLTICKKIAKISNGVLDYEYEVKLSINDIDSIEDEAEIEGDSIPVVPDTDSEDEEYVDEKKNNVTFSNGVITINELKNNVAFSNGVITIN